MKRRIVQISTAGVDNTASTQCNWIITALCDDGSVWVCTNNHGWQQWDDIPQTTIDEGDQPEAPALTDEYAAKCVAACAGLPDGALDGGWTAAGMSAYAAKLERALAPFANHPAFQAPEDWAVTFVDAANRIAGVTAGDFRRAKEVLLFAPAQTAADSVLSFEEIEALYKLNQNSPICFARDVETAALRKILRGVNHADQ